MRYEYVVFDLDGTLIDNEAALMVTLQELIQEQFNKTVPLDELRQYYGIPGLDTAKIWNFPNPEKMVENWDEKYNASDSATKLFDGVLDMLTALKNMQLKLGVVTSKSRKEFDEVVGGKFPELIPFFDSVVCMDDTEKHKPDPAPLLYFAAKSDAQAKDMLYIGDSVHDYKCATRAHVDFGLVGWGTNKTDDFGSTYFFKHPREIIDVVG